MTTNKNDKLELLWKIGYALGIAFLIYTVVPMENRLTKRMDKIEESTRGESKEQFNRFFNYYTECKKEISQIRQEYQKDINTAMEKIYAWFRSENKNKTL